MAIGIGGRQFISALGGRSGFSQRAQQTERVPRRGSIDGTLL